MFKIICTKAKYKHADQNTDNNPLMRVCKVHLKAGSDFPCIINKLQEVIIKNVILIHKEHIQGELEVLLEHIKHIFITCFLPFIVQGACF